MGKSHILYHLAAELLASRQRYRVTYINDCAGWKEDRYGYILKELVMSFYDDQVEGKGIIQWCKDVVGSDKEEKMMMMVDTLIDYTQQQGLQWVVVCDQHNSLHSPTILYDKFPFNIITYLSRNRQNHIRVIISASANNEGYPTEMQGWHTHDIGLHHFDDTEFREWCQQFRLKSDSDDMNLAFFWTGIFLYYIQVVLIT